MLNSFAVFLMTVLLILYFFFRQKAKARVSETLSQPNAEQVAPYGSMEYMPKAWMNFKIDKKAFYQALDSVLLTQ